MSPLIDATCKWNKRHAPRLAHIVRVPYTQFGSPLRWLSLVGVASTAGPVVLPKWIDGQTSTAWAHGLGGVAPPFSPVDWPSREAHYGKLESLAKQVGFEASLLTALPTSILTLGPGVEWSGRWSGVCELQKTMVSFCIQFLVSNSEHSSVRSKALTAPFVSCDARSPLRVSLVALRPV